MRPKRTTFDVYNDGVLRVCSPQNDEWVLRNIKSVSDLVIRYPLNYSQETSRDEDISFAESRGRTLNLKVKTPNREEVRKDDNILIGNTLYSIIHCDHDRKRNRMYFYLEEVRELV